MKIKIILILLIIQSLTCSNLGKKSNENTLRKLALAAESQVAALCNPLDVSTAPDNTFITTYSYPKTSDDSASVFTCDRINYIVKYSSTGDSPVTIQMTNPVCQNFIIFQVVVQPDGNYLAWMGSQRTWYFINILSTPPYTQTILYYELTSNDFSYKLFEYNHAILLSDGNLAFTSTRYLYSVNSQVLFNIFDTSTNTLKINPIAENYTDLPDKDFLSPYLLQLNTGKILLIFSYTLLETYTKVFDINGTPLSSEVKFFSDSYYYLGIFWAQELPNGNIVVTFHKIDLGIPEILMVITILGFDNNTNAVSLIFSPPLIPDYLLTRWYVRVFLTSAGFDIYWSTLDFSSGASQVLTESYDSSGALLVTQVIVPDIQFKINSMEYFTKFNQLPNGNTVFFYQRNNACYIYVAYRPDTTTLPTCKNLAVDLKVNVSQNLDFVVTDDSTPIGSLKIRLKTLPTVGDLKITAGVAADLITDYSISDLKYFTAVSSDDSFTFVVVDDTVYTSSTVN